MTTQLSLPIYPEVSLEVIHGDCLDVMREMADNSIDFIVTDPPYGLHFMSKKWDSEIPLMEYWVEALRVCKPGAMLAAFGGSRTHHHLMLAIEAAGWEIRDVIMWLYGSGFPKSHNVSKAIDKEKGLEREFLSKNPANRPYCYEKGETSTGWKSPPRPDKTKSSCELAKTFEGYGTALKPAYEAIIIAMKPLEGTFAQNAEKWGVAGINIDESRILTDDSLKRPTGKNPITFRGLGNFEGQEQQGRWPANLILDEESAAELDQMTGISKSSNKPRNNKARKGNSMGQEYDRIGYGHDDSGGASRFFYCAKSSSSERNRGLEGMPLKEAYEYGSIKKSEGRTGVNTPRQNSHPTVKPIALMKYIIKLLAPPGNPILLDPFCGSGSTLVAAKELGISCIGIEKEQEYVEIAKARLK